MMIRTSQTFITDVYFKISLMSTYILQITEFFTKNAGILHKDTNKNTLLHRFFNHQIIHFKRRSTVMQGMMGVIVAIR